MKGLDRSEGPQRSARGRVERRRDSPPTSSPSGLLTSGISIRLDDLQAAPEETPRWQAAWLAGRIESISLEAEVLPKQMSFSRKTRSEHASSP